MSGLARAHSRQWNSERLCGVVLCVATICCVAAAAFAQTPYVRIAKSGDPVPGLPGATYDTVGMPAIDATGRVSIRASLEGPGIDNSNDETILHGRPGSLGILTRDGELFPQFGEGVYQRTLSQPVVAQTGQIGYDAKLDGPGITTSDDDIFWAGPLGSLQVVARQGQAPPGITDGGTLGTFSVAMGRGGHVGIRGGISGPGELQRQGLWSGTPDDPRLVTYSGAPAPGTEPGVTFPATGVLVPTWTLNGRGAVAFPASLEGPGIDGTNNAGIWAGTADDLGLVMRAGDAAPLPEPNARFVGEPSHALINGNDRVLFPAFVTGDGITQTNDRGLWAASTSGAPELVLREGDDVPVLGAGYTVTGFTSFLQTEDDRVLVAPSFAGAGVTAANDEAILFGEPGDWELIFREGDQAPGLPDGVVFEFTNQAKQFTLVESGAAGMILGLGGVGVTETNDEALFWRRSEFDPWQLVAREGELFDGSIIRDGGLDISVSGGSTGARPSLNDRGDFVFWVRFAGEFPNEVTGAYVVPSPGPAVMLAVGFIGIQSRRRRSSG